MKRETQFCSTTTCVCWRVTQSGNPPGELGRDLLGPSGTCRLSFIFYSDERRDQKHTACTQALPVGRQRAGAGCCNLKNKICYKKTNLVVGVLSKRGAMRRRMCRNGVGAD